MSERGRIWLILVLLCLIFWFGMFHAINHYFH